MMQRAGSRLLNEKTRKGVNTTDAADPGDYWAFFSAWSTFDMRDDRALSAFM